MDGSEHRRLSWVVATWALACSVGPAGAAIAVLLVLVAAALMHARHRA